jgi:hypothetical protein
MYNPIQSNPIQSNPIQPRQRPKVLSLCLSLFVEPSQGGTYVRTYLPTHPPTSTSTFHYPSAWNILESPPQNPQEQEQEQEQERKKTTFHLKRYRATTVGFPIVTHIFYSTLHYQPIPSHPITSHHKIPTQILYIHGPWPMSMFPICSYSQQNTHCTNTTYTHNTNTYQNKSQSQSRPRLQP